MGMEDGFENIGKAFLNAPFENLAEWDSPLHMLAEATGSTQAQLIGQNFSAKGWNSVLFHHITDPRPGAAEDYFNVGAERAEVNWKAAMRSSPMRIIRDDHYMAVAERRGRKDQFTDYLKEYDGFHGAHTTLINDGDALFTLALLRDRPIAAEDIDRFRAIASYAHAAALMQRSLEGRGAAITAQTLETLGIDAFLLDRNRRVQAMTGAAERMAQAGALLTIRSGQVRAVSRNTDKALQAAISGGLDGRLQNALALPHSFDSHGSAVADLFALPAREWSFGFEPRLLIVIRQPHDVDAERRKLLSQLFELTEAEADVALHIANGLDRNEIAFRRNSSVATVQELLKRIFRKTDVRREGGLVALLNRFLRP